ncbi:MAG: folate/biopterin family MFS transporter [Okeania sp. SIO2G4]|uniref:folate/biopterin family MFS transporter n=1 Tax=unclassified Okeania TaxID=2634635 RepID=UPI0013B66145|nr:MULTISPECIES: folate/biopterin family MFS transporter [unclassified Okeania]NEP70725.1 folate/biopterin family MFS transporter [Okeania sp. SIO2G5]NEP93424.1 folate/biopterin family MFS transporter [Okeania sp. SIO2F5]NEQ92721.1 folate/biopterin family MFS transporter [Okeania sp. SIO2G4]
MFISSQGIIKLKKSLKQRVFFGNEPTPELMAILLVYFVQGILGLGRLAVSFFLKDELAMSPAEVSAMLGVVVIPWMIKPVFGFISDGVPILGYRRRPYMIFSGILGAFSWVALAKWVHTPLAATGAIALSSLSVAISDVIVDSLVVQRVQKESVSSTGSLQSLCWAASALGGLITAYLSGYLLEHFSNQTVFLMTAIFPLIVSAVAWLIDEEKVTIGINFDNVKQQIKQVKIAVTKKSILLPTAFLFLWQATPNSESAFFFFSTNELGFQPEFLGRIRLVTSIAAFIGVWLFQRFFKSVPFRQIFGWSIVISAVLGMTTLLLVTHANRSLGIDDHWFSLGDSLVLTVMGEIAFMPVLVLAARLCPPGVEATLFALLMSIYNLAGLISHEGGALLMHWLEVTETNFDNLWLLIVITNLSTLLPLFLLNWLPAANAQMEENENINSLSVLELNSISSEVGRDNFLPEYLPEMVPTPSGKNSQN